jgi:RecJ-like exonuclease
MSEHPYLTRDITEALSGVISAAVAAVTAGTEANPKEAYGRLLDAYMSIDEATAALWQALYVLCPECDGKSAVDQTDTCPLCGPHMGYIPRHQFARVDPIWQDPAPVVVCPVCDGECDTIVDGYAKPCPACDGIGRLAKEDAVMAVYQLNADADEGEDEGGKDDCHGQNA